MDIFKKLTSTLNASGEEGAIADIIKNFFKDKGVESFTDSFGNLIVNIGNEDADGTKNALFVPMDAPGLVVTYIENDGRVKVAPLGSINYKSVCFTTVTNGKKDGILLPDNGEAESIDKSHICFGFKSRTEAEKHLAVADVLFFKNTVTSLANGFTAGVGVGTKALISAVLKAFEDGKLSQGLHHIVFCSQSLIVQRGAQPAAFGVKPNNALCLSSYGGKTVGIKVLDKSLVCDKELTEKLYTASKKHSGDAEKVICESEMSDAGKVQSAFVGVKVASCMLPVKNIGTSAEIVGKSDIDTLANIIGEFFAII